MLVSGFMQHEVKVRPVTGRTRANKPILEPVETSTPIRAMVEQLTMSQRAQQVRGSMTIEDVSDTKFFIHPDEADNIQEGVVLHAYGKDYMVTGVQVLRDQLTFGMGHIRVDTKPFREA